MEKLVADPLHQDLNSAADALTRLMSLISDIIDGFESIQVLYAKPVIEAQLADRRYVRDRLAKLIEQFRASR